MTACAKLYTNPVPLDFCTHVIEVCLSNQSASEKHKKSPQTFAHLVHFSKNVSAMFDNHTILLF